MKLSYPVAAFDRAIRAVLWMCRSQPVAIDVTDLTDSDVAKLIVDWNKVGLQAGGDFYDLATYYQPEGAYDMRPVMMASGYRVVDFRKLVESYL